MELNKICAAAVIALGALTMACHAGQAVQERRNPQYTMVSRRVMAGETLWEIAKRYHTAMQSVLEANSQLELSPQAGVSKREMLLIPILSH